MRKTMRTLNTGLLRTYADFDSWAEQVRQAFLDVGCVQTSWEGQYTPNGTTAALPQSYAYHGNYVFEVNDDYSNDTPLYVKVEIGSVYFTNTRTDLAGVVRLVVGFGDNTPSTGFKANESVATGNPFNVWTDSSINMAWQQNKIIIAKTDRALVILPNVTAGLYGSNATGNDHIVAGSGYFAVERGEFDDGSVNTDSFDLIWSCLDRMYAPMLNRGWVFSKHCNVKKNIGVSTVASNGFGFNPVSQVGGVLVATPYNKSLRDVRYSKNLVAINSIATELSWTEVDFSIDGIASNKYLLIPTMGLASAITIKPLGVVLDARFNGGFLGVIWDD